MAATSDFNSSVKTRLFILTADVSLTGTTADFLQGETSGSFNLTQDTIEVSSKDTAGFKKFIGGQKSATLNASMIAYYEARKDGYGGKAQVDLINALFAGQEVHCFWGNITGPDLKAKEGYYCKAIITSVGETNDANGVLTRDIALQSTGNIEFFATGMID